MYRLGLLVCDFVPEELRDRFEDYPTMFGTALASAAVNVDWQLYRVYAGQLPASPEECDGYITTGSRNGAADCEQWIRALEQFVRDLVDSSRPLVGICFGYQVIAQALGGKVEKSTRGWGIGLQRYNTEPSHEPSWLQPQLSEFTVPVCHQDQVTRLPGGANLLAGNAHCENFMVQFNDTMLGFQGHPEFDKRFIEVLLELRQLTITGAVRDDAIKSLSRRGDNLTIMRWIVNFLGIDNQAMTSSSL